MIKVICPEHGIVVGEYVDVDKNTTKVVCEKCGGPVKVERV